MKPTCLPVLVLACILSVPLRVAAQESAAQQTAKNLVERGNEKAAIGDFKEAIIDYKQALNFTPNYARAYYNLGVVSCNLGNTNAEISYFTQAIKYEPKDPDSWIERGIALVNHHRKTLFYRNANMDDIESAISSINQGLKLNPSIEKQARAYWGLGYARQFQGDASGEVANFTRSIQLNSNFPGAYFARANAYLELATIYHKKAEIPYTKKAVSDYSKAIKLHPRYADAYQNRSFAYAKLGNNKAAISDIKTAADIYYQQKELAAYREAMSKLEELKKQSVSYY